MNEGLGKLHFWLTFVGAYCIFMPFHYLGLAGNVRRYSAFVEDYLQPLLPVHDPYQYGIASSTGDYVMQNSPEQIQTVRDDKSLT